jgi:putative methionine-R-sulfoxide reductase with GAF domain
LLSRYTKHIILLLLIYCAIVIPRFNANAQTIKDLENGTLDNFTKYNYKNGLSNDNIKCISQDDDGFIWVGTQFGLNKFDGHEFVSYTIGTAPVYLPSNKIEHVKNMGNNQMGISTSKGFVLFNTKTYQSTLFALPDSSAFQQYANLVWDASLIGIDRLAITTASGFYIFNMQGKVVFRYDGYNQADVEKKTIRYGREIFNIGNSEFIIFANSNNVAYYNSKTNIYVHELNNSNFKYPIFSQQPPGLISRNEIDKQKYLLLQYFRDTIIYYDHIKKRTTYSKLTFPVSKNIGWYGKILELNDSTFLLNAYKGFFVLHLNTSNGIVTADTNRILGDVACFRYFIDKEKRLWMGTNNGLYAQKTIVQPIKIIKNNTTLKNAIGGFNRTILRYKDKYYVGKYAKHDSSLIILNAKTLAIEKKIVFANGLENEYREILSIQQYHNDTLLVSTLKGILWFNVNNYSYGKYLFPKQFDKYNKVEWPYLYPIDAHGNAWILYSFSGLVCKYNIANREYYFYSLSSNPALPFEKIKDIVYDSYGDVWVSGIGLTRYNYAINTFDTLMLAYGGPNKLSNDIIEITADNNGSLWLQTAENNLIEYKIKQKQYTVYNEANGMPKGYVCSFSRAVNNKLWMLQPHKLISIDVITKKIETFGATDGLPDDLVIANSKIYYDSVAQKLVGIYETQLAFIPISISNKVTSNTSIFITSLHADNKKMYYNIGEKCLLPSNSQQALLHFTIIDFENANEYDFSYKINNNDWVAVLNNRVVQLNNLQAGIYKVTIKAVDKSGKEIIKTTIIQVATPFWKSWWFKLIVLVMSVLGIISIIKWREKIQKEAANEKLLSQQLKNESLQQQLEMEKITNYFTYSVADKNNVEDVLWDVANNLIGKLGFEDCIIYLWNKDKTKMIQKAGYGPKGSIEELNKLPFDVAAGQGVVGYVMQTKEALIINDTSIDARYRPDEAVRFSEICVPIIYNDSLIGVLDSEHQQKNFYTQRHLHVMTTIATLIANKIISIESESGLQQQKLEVANLNQQLAEFEMKALHTQMNPHFIFNCLGTIKSMILDNQPEQASKYLSKFAKMIRLTLNHSIEAFISLEQNNEYIHHYLEIENMRFGNAFEYEIIIDNAFDVEEVKIPPMMIQPLVENAIWHGLLNKQGTKKLVINYSISNHKLICSIDDNGLGINKTKGTNKTHKSVGIDNIKQRLLLLNEKYKTDCSLTIEDKNDNDTTTTGTLAIITLPYILNDLP